MLNEQMKITAENEMMLYVKMALKNIDFALISVDFILNTETIDRNIYEDEHTFYFYYIQNLLAACGNLANVFDNPFGYTNRNRYVSPYQRSKALCEKINLNIKDYPYIFQKEVRNTNMHFDERYDEYDKRIGDYNIIDENTPDAIRRAILNTPHLRTYNKQEQVYITVGRNRKRIEYPLRQLRQELEALKLLLYKSIK